MPLRWLLGRHVIAVNSVVLSIACVLLVSSGYSQSAKNSSNGASKVCGAVLPLDKAGMQRLDLVKRLATFVDNAGFTKTDDEQLSRDEIDNLIASSYFLAYLTWNRPEAASRERMNKMVDKAAGTVDHNQLTISEKEVINAWVEKIRAAMVEAFELGRHDALRNPCPF